MSGFQAESEIEENDNNLVLFDMRGSKKPQYWKFIKLIAPKRVRRGILYEVQITTGI